MNRPSMPTWDTSHIQKINRQHKVDQPRFRDQIRLCFDASDPSLFTPLEEAVRRVPNCFTDFCKIHHIRIREQGILNDGQKTIAQFLRYDAWLQFGSRMRLPCWSRTCPLWLLRFLLCLKPTFQITDDVLGCDHVFMCCRRFDLTRNNTVFK